MLGKLLKYEMKSTARTFLPLYAILLISAFVSGLLMENPGLAAGISSTIFFGLCVAVFVMTILILIQRFQKNLLQDEGYLMMTLPVKTHTLIFSKLIPALIWSIASMFTGMLAFFLLVIPSAFNANFFTTLFQEFLPQFFQLLGEIPGDVYLILFQSALFSLLSLSAFILMVYLSLSTGQLPAVAKHRRLASFMSFIILYIINQIIIIKSTIAIGNMYSSNQFYASTTEANIMLLFMIVVVLAINTIYFLMTNFILQKHLNLE